MSSSSKSHIIAFALCMLGLTCADGFVLGQRSPSWAIRHRSTLARTNLGVPYEDEYSNVVYPTDTLQSIGINSTLTLVPDIAYFYLQNTLGLSEETMWKITLESGSILGMTPRNLEKKVSLLRRTMNLSDEDIRVMLGKQPALLHYSAERNLAPTILFLVRALDLSKGELRKMVMECPSILSYSLENLGKKISFFVRTLGYSADGEDGMTQARELLVATPKLLLSAVDSLESRMKFLQLEIQFSLDELRVLYEKNPRLLLYSLDDNLREKIVFFFILQLHMEPEDVRKMLLSYPSVMDYNLENHLKPIAEFFIAELGFSGSEFGRIIIKFPRLFSYSLVKIKHVTGFLRYELELDSRQVKRVIFQAPQVFGLTEDSLKEKLDLIRYRLRLTAEEMGQLFSKIPTVACLGVQSNLLPKLEYLGRALVDDRGDVNSQLLLKQTLLKQPTLLGYSLEGRIRPRMEQLIAAGLSPDKLSVGISMTDANFQQWLASSQSRKMEHTTKAKRIEEELNVLVKDMKFTEDELKVIRAKTSGIEEWSVSKLGSWISYLKEELRLSDAELKQVLMSQPMLLDGSSHRSVKSRFKQLRSANLSLVDNLDTICLPGDEFDECIRSARSKIGYVQRTLGLNATEVDKLLSQAPSLGSTQVANKIFQRKLTYFLAEFGNSTEAVKSLVSEQPSMLDLPTKTAEQRMRKIRQAGVSDPRTVAGLLVMSDGEFDAKMSLVTLRSEFPETVKYLKTSTLQLNESEIDSLLPSLSNNLAPRGNIESIFTFILSLVDGDVERAKATVLEHPHLVSYSLDDLVDRVDRVKSSPHTTTDLVKVVAMTDSDYQIYLSLRRKLNFTDKEIDSLLAGSGSMLWHNDTLSEKIDYLLSQGTTDEVKNAVLSRPKLLSQPLQAMQNMTNVLATKRNKHTTPLFWNVSGGILRDTLGLVKEDVDFVLSQSRYVTLRDPEDYLMPKLHYLLSVFGGSKNDTASCILANPGLLDHSLTDWIMPRMKLLIGAGLDPHQITSLSARQMTQRAELQLRLNLTEHELERIMPAKACLAQRRPKQTIEPTIEYLSEQLNGSIDDLKHILLEEPKLVTLSLSKTIQPRMGMILEAGCSPQDISRIVALTPREAEEHCLTCYLSRRLGFSSKENDLLLATIRTTRPSCTGLNERLRYLHHQVFKGSKRELKAAILRNPTLLKQSMQSLRETVEPRMEAIHFLESIGVDFQPSDTFFTQSESALVKELLPRVKSWYPTSSEPDGIYEEEADSDGTSKKKSLLAALNDFSPTVALAYSDESNRDAARVVHWR